MAYNSYLSTNLIPIANCSGSCNSSLRCYYIIFTNFDVVCNLNKVVYFSSFTNNCGTDCSTIYRAIGSNFHLIFNNNIPQLWNFFKAIRSGLKSKSIAANYGIGMNYTIITNDAIIVNSSTAIDFAIFTNFHAFADIDLGENLSSIAYFCFL